MASMVSDSGRVVRQPDGSFRICIVDEGPGSSADWPRDFFTRENADVLSGVISFPNHPKDYDKPEDRDPMTAIGRVGREVAIEVDPETSKIGFWADYFPSKRPGVAEHLEEFGDILGVSVFCEGSTRLNPATGREEAVAFDPTDPYRSVDVVVVPGRGGKFKRMAEAHRRLAENASAPAEEHKEETKMDKDIEDRFSAVEKMISDQFGDLAKKLEGTTAPKVEELQAQVDQTAIDAAVDTRLTDYDKAVDLISGAQLTESQSSDLRARARKGEDITGAVETAKKVLAEARAGRGGTGEIEPHLGGGTGGESVDGLSFDVPGVGRVSI
jgi:hypothetical protein